MNPLCECLMWRMGLWWCLGDIYFVCFFWGWCLFVVLSFPMVITVEMLSVPKNMKLLAVPLFELYDNTARYGPQLSVNSLSPLNSEISLGQQMFKFIALISALSEISRARMIVIFCYYTFWWMFLLHLIRCP